MIKILKIYKEGIKTSLASRMAYRGDFLFSFFIMLAVELLTPFITILIYANGASFPGWNIYEVLLIQGIFLLSRGISFPFFFGMVWNVIGRVREGTLDLLYIKPRSILFLSIITGFDSEDLGKLLGGIFIFTVAITHVTIPSFMNIIQFIFIFVISLLIHFGFAMIMAGLGIIWVGNFRVYDIFFSLTNFGMYPGSIFSKSLQTVITMIIPVALLGFVPASVLLGRPTVNIFLVIVTSLVFISLSYCFWRLMHRRYTSAGG